MKKIKFIVCLIILVQSNIYAQKHKKKNVQQFISNRVLKIKSSEIGDQICYSQDFTQTESGEGFFIFHAWKKETNFKMVVQSYIEKKIGDKFQIRIAKIESNDDLYTNPTYRGITLYTGDVIWINPIKDENWIICE